MSSYADQLESRIAQLAECAAGPWRKPTDEDYYILLREAMAVSLPDDPKLIGIWSEEEDLEFVATINPPESASCAR